MRPSFMRTLLLPATPTTDAKPLLTAGQVPLRVVVRNIGAQNARLSFVSNDLMVNPIASDNFTVPTENEDIFILAPEQTLYGVGTDAGSTTVSVAVSEAYPVL